MTKDEANCEAFKITHKYSIYEREDGSGDFCGRPDNMKKDIATALLKLEKEAYTQGRMRGAEEAGINKVTMPWVCPDCKKASTETAQEMFFEIKTLEKNINGLEATISAKQNTIAELEYVIKEEVAESKYLKAKLEEAEKQKDYWNNKYWNMLDYLQAKLTELEGEVKKLKAS